MRDPLFFSIFCGKVHDSVHRVIRLLRFQSHALISLPGPGEGRHLVDVSRILSPPRECRILLGVVWILTLPRPDHPDELMAALLVHGHVMAGVGATRATGIATLVVFLPEPGEGRISSTFHVYVRRPANVASTSALPCFLPCRVQTTETNS